MASVIQYESVRFRYEDGETEILRDLSLEIEPGQFTVIAGPSGEGKSTFCRTLNNIIPLFFKGEFSGKRWVAGEWLEKQSTSSIARKVGMVFQDFEQQLFSTNALLELSFGLENFGVSRAEMDQRMEELLERFHLRHLSRREPFSMSGGEKQKLAIASVLAYKPQILVLDEPTTDLDPESKHFVMQTLPELKDWVETVLIVDHETDRFQDADRVFLFREGTIQSSGTPSEILTNSTLLESNSLAPLDLAVLQARLNEKAGLATPMELASSWSGSQLQPLDWPARTAAPAVIDVTNLSYRYENRDVEALQDVSFEIRKGEFLGIIGQNGSGKSTLLRHLNGLQHPQQGSIRILGKEIREWNRKDLSKTTALVFQNPDHQIFNTTVREEVEFGPLQLGFSEDQRKKNVERALQTMDLEAQQQRDPFQLSKGERQRVAVACMLSVSPEILMLDEPTTGLDYRQQTYLMQLLRELNKEGATIIIVTHSLKLVGDYCNYAILMEKGQKKAEGHPRDLFFRNGLFHKLPPLWELSRIMKGNALTVDEFASSLKKRQ
jgi:energy-coupling factor transport system ATP-binding protein